MPQTIFAWGGMIAGLLILVLLVLMGFKSAIDAAEELWSRHDARVEAATRREVGQRIVSDAVWFSENYEAYTLLRLVGEAIADGGYIDGYKIRRTWRCAIKSHAKEQADKAALLAAAESVEATAPATEEQVLPPMSWQGDGITRVLTAAPKPIESSSF